MILPRSIDWLCTLRQPGGGNLVAIDAIQILVPVFPPNTLLTINAGPIDEDYGQIIYYFRFGLQMVPNAFRGTLSIWGHRPLTGIWTQSVLETEFTGFRWVTASQSSQLQMTNITGLNQVFEFDYSSVRISTEADYYLVLEALDRLGSSAKSETLQQEANLLLRQMVTGEPAPLPPIGGSE